MALLAAAGAHWLAGRVISPVSELAREVAAAAADAPPRLAADKPDDEIGELARAFDRYLARLAAFVERERAFAADASHELRTPLAVIRGAAEVLADDPGLDEAQLRRIARIERAANEMSELTAALLLLAREEETAVDEPCDCAEVVAACVERHRTAANRRRNRLELSVDAPVALEVAPAYFAIVVDNLIRNALAHTEDGQVAVRLQADRLVVADTGSGIASGDLVRVFERHYRGPASAGAGIGLSLVKRICERHGWRIELQGRPGGGTVATLGFAA
jgi:signal transduction histidine kinase